MYRVCIFTVFQLRGCFLSQLLRFLKHFHLDVLLKLQTININMSAAACTWLFISDMPVLHQVLYEIDVSLC